MVPINSFDDEKAQQENKSLQHNVFEDAVNSLAKEPPISLESARASILDEMHTEHVRHETVISVEIHKYESFIRLENENYERRLEELNNLVAMFDARMEKKSE